MKEKINYKCEYNCANWMFSINNLFYHKFGIEFFYISSLNFGAKERLWALFYFFLEEDLSVLVFISKNCLNLLHRSLFYTSLIHKRGKCRLVLGLWHFYLKSILQKKKDYPLIFSVIFAYVVKYFFNTP